MAVNLNENDFQIFNTSTELFTFAAKDFLKKSIEAVKQKNEFTVVLSGGNTPKSFFDILSSYKNDIPWDKIKFFFSDERYVPADDIQSNYNMAHNHLFSKVSVNPDHIHRIPTEDDDPKLSAKKYEQIIRREMKLQDHECPKFDLCYLGLGSDAHTASLWPHSEIVMRYANNHMKDESTKLVTDVYVSDAKLYRITLTPNAINSSKKILFMVLGADKSEAVYEVIEGELDPALYPAQLIERVHTPTEWYLDKGAAEKLIRFQNLSKKKSDE